jgi:phytoene synthase
MPDGTPEIPLADSTRHCLKVARGKAKNFFYGFLLLPTAKRDALCALYAFMRGVDDIADEPGSVEEKRRRLAERRAEMDIVLAGGKSGDPVWPAFRHTMKRYSIPLQYLHDLISGAEMDQAVRDYEAFDQLLEYCYRVAGTVGLACLHVFGFQDQQAPKLAKRMGIAFQLTNILRDVADDLAMGRIYLPREDLRKFGCREEDLRAGHFTEEWRALIEFEVRRAREYYSEAFPLLYMIEEDSRAALWALVRIYVGVLERIETRNYDVFAPPAPRLSTAAKLWILARARMGWRGDMNALRIRDRGGRRPGGSLVGRRAG